MKNVPVNPKVNTNGLILAIDLGKYKSVVCVYEPAEPSWQLTSFTGWVARPSMKARRSSRHKRPA